MISLHPVLAKNSRQKTLQPRLPQTEPPAKAFNLLGDRFVKKVGLSEPGLLVLCPFGTGVPGTSFTMRLWRWERVDGRNAYIPFQLLEARITLAAIDAGVIDKNTLLSDTISLPGGQVDPEAITVISRGRNQAACIRLHAQGCPLLEFEFATDTDDPAVSANCFLRPVPC